MINQELADIFEKMGEILEFQGNPGDIFRIRAYRAASLALRDVGESVEKIAHEKRLRDIPGVGEGIAKKIEEYIARGSIAEFKALRRSIPEGFFELLAIPSMGPKKVRTLFLKLDVKNCADLKKAIESGKVESLAGFGEKSARKLLEGIKVTAQYGSRRLIGSVFLTVSVVIESLRKLPEVEQAVVAGSFRRCEETVGDVDILVTGDRHRKIMDAFVRMPFVAKVIGSGETKTSVLTHDGLQIDVRVVDDSLYGSALQYFTGSKLHNVHLRTIAKSKGFKLSEYGFFKGTKRVASTTEEECYKALKMQYIPPEIRTDTGEIEAAMRHEIPRLVELRDIRGDLHAHSTWSDGTASIRQMVVAAQKLGYEYIAITDHSPSTRVAGGLSRDQLTKKKKEIEALKKEFKIHILFGTEVDILADGSLDYDDTILAEFDVVVASVHSRFGQDNTRRIMRAMEHPHVDIIGHPSGRRIGKRAPYPIDYDALFTHAASTGTILEIDAQPERLDLEASLIRRAKEFGCRFAINSDAHSVSALGLMGLGVGWARRGWAQKKDIVNTMPWSQLKNIFEK